MIIECETRVKYTDLSFNTIIISIGDSFMQKVIKK